MEPRQLFCEDDSKNDHDDEGDEGNEKDATAVNND